MIQSLFILLSVLTVKVLSDCKVFNQSQKVCGDGIEKCEYFERDPDSDLNCRLICSIFDLNSNQCGGDTNRCQQFQQSKLDENKCIYFCHSLVNNICGNDDVRCSKYTINSDKKTCGIPCDIRGELGCGDNNSYCYKFEYDTENNDKCRLKCTTSNSEGICGNDSIRCSDFIKNNQLPNTCYRKCDTFGQSSCGDDPKRCTGFVQDSHNKKICNNKCLDFNGKCGDDSNECEIYEQDPENKYRCIRKCSSYGEQSCGNDSKRCKLFIPTYDKVKKDCYSCLQTSDWSDSQCQQCHGKGFKASLDQTKCLNAQQDSTTSASLLFSILIYLFIAF